MTTFVSDEFSHHADGTSVGGSVEYMFRSKERMSEIERIHEHPSIEDHDLYLARCRSFSEVVPAVSALASRHFVALIIADFKSTTLNDIAMLSEQLIEAGARYFCAWGPGCHVAHRAFDLACCDFEADTDRVIMTTDHNNESLEEAIWYSLNCAYPVDPYDRECHATVAICINDEKAESVVRDAFSEPVAFSERDWPPG